MLPDSPFSTPVTEIRDRIAQRRPKAPRTHLTPSSDLERSIRLAVAITAVEEARAVLRFQEQRLEKLVAAARNVREVTRHE